MGTDYQDKLVELLQRSALKDREYVASRLDDQTISARGTRIRHVAARKLGKLGGPGVAKRLELLLEDPDWHMRQEAALALGQVGDPRVVPSLVRLGDDEVWQVRAAAGGSLDEIGDVRGTPIWIRLLEEQPHLNRFAVRALRTHGDARGVEPLRRAAAERSFLSGLRYRHAAWAITRRARAHD